MVGKLKNHHRKKNGPFHFLIFSFFWACWWCLIFAGWEIFVLLTSFLKMNDIPEEKYLPEFQFDFNVLLLQFISKSEREGYKYHCCRGLIYSISYMVVTSPWILSIIQFNPWKQDIWQLLGIMLPFFNIVIGWAAWKKVTGVSSYKDMLSVRHCIDNRNDSILPNILWRMRGELSLNVHTLDSFLPTSCICEADSCGHVHLVVGTALCCQIVLPRH